MSLENQGVLKLGVVVVVVVVVVGKLIYQSSGV